MITRNMPFEDFIDSLYEQTVDRQIQHMINNEELRTTNTRRLLVLSPLRQGNNESAKGSSVCVHVVQQKT